MNIIYKTSIPKLLVTWLSAIMLLLGSMATFALPAIAGATGEATLAHSYSRACYMASSAFTTPAAATTDMFEIYGSSTKTIKIERLEVAYVGTGNNVIPTKCFLLKRSSANTVGTAVTQTAIPVDSSSAAATAVAKVYSANPTTGSSLGQISSSLLNCNPLLNGSNPPPRIVLYDAHLAGQPITLRGTAQGLVANFNGVIPDCTGPALSWTVTWTEE